VDVIAAVDAGIIQSLNIRATAQLKREALHSLRVKKGKRHRLTIQHSTVIDGTGTVRFAADVLLCAGAFYFIRTVQVHIWTRPRCQGALEGKNTLWDRCYHISVYGLLPTCKLKIDDER
jgi:hypothetical protein